MTARLTATSADGDCAGWVVAFVVGQAGGVVEGIDSLALECGARLGRRARGDADARGRSIP